MPPETAAARGMLVTVRDVEPLPFDEETRLVERARGGDRAAFDRLVERHLPRVWRVVWRIVRHDQDAEDVVQEVFLTAYRGLGGFRGGSRFSTWLHRIAVTRSLNHLDRAAVRAARAAAPLDAQSEARLNRTIDAAGPSNSPGPLAQLEAMELEQRLARCLERLPAPWRAVIALRDGEELSYAKMAEALGVALGTVRSRLSRARLALRECLEEGLP